MYNITIIRHNYKKRFLIIKIDATSTRTKIMQSNMISYKGKGKANYYYNNSYLIFNKL